MSKIIATRAIKGAHTIVTRADEMLKKAIAEKGADAKLEFPDTAYYLPLIYAVLGLKVTKLKEAVAVIDKAKSLLPAIPTENLWLPYLGNTLDAGMATILAEEVIEALKYVFDPNFVKEPWLGFTGDTILREQGIKLVDGRMPGFAALVGACPTNEEAVKLVRQLQERNILIFIASSTNGKSVAEQLHEEGIEMGWDNYIVPYGKDTSSAVLALDFAARSAMTFGGITPKGLKEARDILMYNKNRVNAFVIALGEVDDEKFATAAGAINFGFPCIADTDIDQILPTGICRYEHVVSPITLENMVNKSIEVRGLKITVQKLPIPVSYGPAFEGERVRKEQLGVEFGGKYSKSFEYVKMKGMDEVEDNKITVIGPDIDTVPDGGNLPLGIFVEVAGRKMQKEFETILERKLHGIMSEAMGVMHTGQRNLTWIRINKEAIKSGLRLNHIGVMIHAMLLKEFPAIVDKVRVTIYTNLADVEKILPEAIAAYKERDERMAGMTDETVDIFYSCQLCQSYAPNHICIITPERLGLCGSYNWLDGKAAYEINPTGANQPVKKGAVIDAVKGQWQNVNDFVYDKSNRMIEKFNAYSIMDFPETSCGCFECIVAIVPEANGVMIVNRGFTGMTPVGMTFSTLAGSVGGGLQTPGFLGVGRLYITSKKFISAEGGFHRILWMPKELKEALMERLKKRAEELGTPDFVDKIADETIATTSEEMLPFLQKVNHPALSMPSLI
jgi:acetyl-CoA synthase